MSIEILKIYAELLNNPQNLAAYRVLIDYYKDEFPHISQAFSDLVDHSHPDLQQRLDHPENAGFGEICRQNPDC